MKAETFRKVNEDHGRELPTARGQVMRSGYRSSVCGRMRPERRRELREHL